MSNIKWERQKSRITNLSLILRKKYYNEHKCENCYYDTPHGIAGNMTESIGAWPEFIFRGTFCKRTFQGYCSPCFYSQFPIDKKETGISYKNMIRKQFNYVIQNFKELVVNRQYDFLDNSDKSSNMIRFVLTPTGSFFDEAEFPQKIRIEMLSKLVNFSNEYGFKLQLHIECHCKDLIEIDINSEDTKFEFELLKKLHTKVLFGFESADEYVRNVLYNKNLSMNEFLQAYRIAKRGGLDVGVFVFAGLFSMNDALTISDVRDSIRFAVEKKITPVIMFQNVQQNTLTDLLFHEKQINLIEPFTVMEIILCLIDELKHQADWEDWLIADPKGGPPVPEYNIFDCAKITSKKNASKIYEMVRELRLTRDFDGFIQEANDLRKSENYLAYKKHLAKCRGRDYLEEDTDSLLSYAEQMINRNNGENKYELS